MEKKNNIFGVTTIAGLIIFYILSILYTMMNIAPFYIYSSGEVTYDIRGVSLIYMAAVLCGYLFFINILYRRITISRDMALFLTSYAILIFASIFILLVSVLNGRILRLKSFIEFCILWFIPCLSLFIGIDAGKVIDIDKLRNISRVTLLIMFMYFIYLLIKDPIILFRRPYAAVAYMLFLPATVEIWDLIRRGLTTTGIIISVISILLMLISGTRSIILSALIFTLLLLIINKKYKGLIIIGSIVLISILLFNVLQFHNPSLIRIQEAAKFDIHIFHTRSLIWRMGLEVFSKNPVIGNGWDAFKTSVNLTEGETRIVSSHNLLIRVLIDMGMLGLIIYVVFIATVIKLFLKNDYCIVLILSTISTAFYDDLPQLYPYDLAKLFLITLFWLLVGWFYGFGERFEWNNSQQKLKT